MDCSMPGFPVQTNSWSLLKLMSIESVILPAYRLLSEAPTLLWPLYWCPGWTSTFTGLLVSSLPQAMRSLETVTQVFTVVLLSLASKFFNILIISEVLSVRPHDKSWTYQMIWQHFWYLYCTNFDNSTFFFNSTFCNTDLSKVISSNRLQGLCLDHQYSRVNSYCLLLASVSHSVMSNSLQLCGL